MTNAGSGFGRNFSKDMEAVFLPVVYGREIGEILVYPHELRKNMEIAGYYLDRNFSMPDFPDPFNLPADYEPDFGGGFEDEYEDASIGLNDEEETNV